jgi:outer membrane protein assembly factor BamA
VPTPGAHPSGSGPRDRQCFLQKWLAALASSVAFATGCASVPKGEAAVDAVAIEGNDHVASSDIEEKLATTESPKFLGLLRGVVYDYEVFDKAVLQRDLERVERYYRARGYYEAHARAGRVEYKSDNHVAVTIEVEEGPRTTVKETLVQGVDALAPKEAKAVNRALAKIVKPSDPFEEEPFDKTEDAMVRALTDRGHAWARVTRTADVDLVTHTATLTFSVTPGPKAKFGSVKVEGLSKLPLGPVLRAADIREGSDYSTVTLERAKEAVLGLGAFTSVEVTPILADGPTADEKVAILIRVREQKLRSVLLGGGIELDAIRTQAHLHIGWEHKNLFGGFRHFTVDLRPGLDLYPTRLPNFAAPTTVLPEERFSTSLRQPGFIEARTKGVTAHEFNTYPLLLSPRVDPKAPVVGYLEYKGSLGLERAFWKLFVSPTYNFQYNLPFAYQGRLDRDLRGVAISYVDFLGRFDDRDDRVRPHSGVFLQDDMQFAGIGGNAMDFRVQPEIRGYIPLGSRVTLATRTTVGLLFPLNYGAAAARAEGRTPIGVDKAAWTEDLELIYLRGFFSGGPSSNRGYPLRGVGPHGSVPFLNPELQAQTLAQSCELTNPAYDPVRCGVPLGGLSLWETSLELRFPIWDPLGAVAFCDASDVAARQLTIRLDHPHLSCGVGVRLDTPVGPVRADLGYRIPGAQVPADEDPRLEGDPGTLFGVPLSLAFGLGEAF